jgi:hypothetical protein
MYSNVYTSLGFRVYPEAAARKRSRHSLICFASELRDSKFLFSAILPGLGNYCVPAAGLDFRRIHGKFGARNRCNFRTFSPRSSVFGFVFFGGGLLEALQLKALQWHCTA